MNDLDLLKQDWNKDKPNEFKTYSEEELFRMTKKKSVSIAKWVFIIALCEILFWTGLNYILSNTEKKEHLGIPYAETFINVIDLISEISPYLFCGLVIYLNYKIRNTENPKRLMKKILWMRNSVKWYIKIFLFHIIIAMIYAIFLIYYNLQEKGEFSSDENKLIFLFITLVIVLITFIIVLFIRFIYHLIYGNLIYKLEDNYKELAKMETQD